jgi:hypothetical protein
MASEKWREVELTFAARSSKSAHFPAGCSAIHRVHQRDTHTRLARRIHMPDGCLIAASSKQGGKLLTDFPTAATALRPPLRIDDNLPPTAPNTPLRRNTHRYIYALTALRLLTLALILLLLLVR